MLKDSFDTKDTIFDLFKVDPILLELMGNPVGLEQLYEKFRPRNQEGIVLEDNQLPFLAFYVGDAVPTRNYLVNKGFLYVDYFVTFDAGPIAKKVRELLKTKGWQLVSEGERSTGIPNVYKYRDIFAPLIMA